MPGHNYECVCDVSCGFRRRGVAIRPVINKFTSTAYQRPDAKARPGAPIAFISATTQAQATATKAAKAGRNQACQANEGRAYLDGSRRFLVQAASAGSYLHT